jgi:uncharacterized pyridoxamine 5'-phosphate oxidase family protein
MNCIEDIRDSLSGGYFYIATVGLDGKPKLRPFGAIEEMDGKLYICTNSEKNVSKQMKANPHVQIAATERDESEWLRIDATVTLDGDEDKKQRMLNAFPDVAEIYEENRDIFEIFSLSNIACTHYKSDGTIKHVEL